MSVLFERFISRERNEPPDIDIDFEHERREEVLQYLYAKYGRDRAALTGVVISYRPKSALRDVGKALGFSLATLDAVAREHSRWDGHEVRADRLEERLQELELFSLVRQVDSFRRQFSAHPSGNAATRETSASRAAAPLPPDGDPAPAAPILQPLLVDDEAY
jgi:error-prone DNA polymerase